MNKQQILDFLLEKLAEYQEMSIEPSLKNLIHDLKKEIEDEYVPEGAEADYEDYSGATEGDR